MLVSCKWSNGSFYTVSSEEYVVHSQILWNVQLVTSEQRRFILLFKRHSK